MRADSINLLTLSLDQILADAHFNIRIFFGDIDQLALQLMVESQLDPIKVRRDGDHYFVVDGHRRHRAFVRSRDLSIERTNDHYVVLDRGRPLREAPGPLHGDFDRNRIRCILVDPGASEAELFASQIVHNSGKPFTLLERMIFISRLGRSSGYTREQLALKTGFSRTHIANAQNLNTADPRLLEYVRDGRISQKLALRLLRAFPAHEQLARVCAAGVEADRCHRDKILPKDFDWGAVPAPGARARERGPPSDSVRVRLRELVSRLAEAMRFPPNEVAQVRLETLVRVNRHVTGKETLAELEAFLLGRR